MTVKRVRSFNEGIHQRHIKQMTRGTNFMQQL